MKAQQIEIYSPGENDVHLEVERRVEKPAYAQVWDRVWDRAWSEPLQTMWHQIREDTDDRK